MSSFNSKECLIRSIKIFFNEMFFQRIFELTKGDYFKKGNEIFWIYQ
jgi:hypothetical protein